ncbi:MAG TPA: NAD-dependent epimerase/dehydratase family protein [Nocardioides sp.]|nr:NAD-dependent epimerase/dehydratase family protein [Nocardioides sp.]
MKKVLVTGGAGFIGRHLSDHLTRRGGYEVTVLDNESLGDRHHLDLTQVRFVEGDLRSHSDLRSVLDGQDAVVHLAADTRVMDSIENPAHNFENNVVGTFNLLELCREYDVRRIVAASTGGAIVGDVPPPVHEGMAAQPTSPYGASKLMLEGYLSAYSAAFGLKGCALRFSNIYGPRSFHKGSVVAHFYKQLLADQPLVVYGDGTQARDFLYVGDLVEGIRIAIEGDAVGAYQLGSGQPTTLNELIDIMRMVTGRELSVVHKDFRPGEVLRTWCDIDKARAGMGFDPTTPLEEGLRATWEWFASQGKA